MEDVDDKVEDAPEVSSLLKCQKCDRVFFTERSLRSHSKVHVEKTLECRFCDLKFNRTDILSAHLTMHFFTDLTFFACPINTCDFSSDSSKIFEKHMILSHSVEQLKCEECDGEFANHRKFFTHKILCHGDLKDYWKELIDSKKTRKRKINQEGNEPETHFEIEQEHDEEVEVEPEISETQNFPEILEILRNVLTPVNGETSSEMLQKISEFLSTLFPLENGETFYKCAHCAIGFQDAILWMNHLQFHDQLEPFKCASCARTFENRQAFVIHLTYFQHDRFSS